MNLETAERIRHRWIINRRPGQEPPAIVRHAYSWIDRKAEAKGMNCPPDLYRAALSARDELMSAGQAYSKRAGVRRELASYLANVIYPHTRDYKFRELSDRLFNARRTGTYGTRPNGDCVCIWDDKSNLARLDPDEAREEARRFAERYVPAIADHATRGAGIHYGVFTIPNVDPGKLATAQRAIFRRFSNMLRARADKKKLFPDIMGAVVVAEAPLAEDGYSWNLHLNVILLTTTRFSKDLYKRLRRRWHWNVRIKPIKGDIGDLTRSFNELIKYATRAVPEKSDEHAKRKKSKAPPMVQWTPEQFVEWWHAQKGFRRSRTYGALYGSKVPKPEPLGLDDIVWHGAIHCTPERFYAVNPGLDINLIPGHNLATGSPRRPSTGPP